jgi:hypothetical protein
MELYYDDGVFYLKRGGGGSVLKIVGGENFIFDPPEFYTCGYVRVRGCRELGLWPRFWGKDFYNYMYFDCYANFEVKLAIVSKVKGALVGGDVRMFWSGLQKTMRMLLDTTWSSWQSADLRTRELYSKYNRVTGTHYLASRERVCRASDYENYFAFLEFLEN